MAATTDVWTYLINRTDVIPDDCNWDELSELQQRIILDTVSVEKEWITDHDDWKANTMFTFDDEDGPNS